LLYFIELFGEINWKLQPHQKGRVELVIFIIKAL
jgi:hypothetical protein